MMNPEELKQAFIQVRLAQKEFFKTRSQKDLNRSKELEEKIDIELGLIENDSNQMKLF